MKTFSPFDRLTFWRRGYATETGARARTRAFDGIGDVEALAQEIADRTGVPVGQGRAAVDSSLSKMSPKRRPGA